VQGGGVDDAFTESLQREERRSEDNLTAIVRDGKRASDVISRIQDLVRKAPPRKAALEINGAILDVIALARAEINQGRISPATHLAENLPLVEGDRIQLQQVFLNLIMNAVEAMHCVGEGSRELLIGPRLHNLTG
jgi:C4-dicarboxylate-specific signal transduction histidine kinase